MSSQEFRSLVAFSEKICLFLLNQIVYRVAAAALKLMIFLALLVFILHRPRHKSFVFVQAVGIPVFVLQRHHSFCTFGQRMNR